MTLAFAELLDIARATALEAAELIRLRRSEGVEVAGLKSSSVDVVTYADRESETRIRELIAAARPDDGFYGEEGGEQARGTSGLSWVVDPIDGTVNYLYGIPAYAVSIAVVEGGHDPAEWTGLAGAVVNPVLGEVYTAALGQGAFLGDRRLRANTGVDLEHALLGTGFSYTAVKRAEQAAVVSALLPHVRDIRRMGAASLDLCNVAAGRLDAYYERGIHPWDHAAGAIIAREAGARVGGLDGARESGQLTMAAEPGLYAQLEPLLSAAYSRQATEGNAR